MSEARRRILDEREDTSLSPPWGRLASRGPVPLGEGAATGRQRIDCGGAPSDLDGSSRRRVAGPHEPDGVGADEPRQPAPGRQRLLLQARSGASRPHRAGARPERDDGRELELYRSPAESARLLRVRADLRARPSLPRLRRRDPDRAERARAGVVRGPGARGHPHPQGRSRRPLGGDVHAGVLAEVPRRRQQGQPLRRDDAAVRRHQRRRPRSVPCQRRPARTRPADRRPGGAVLRLLLGVPRRIPDGPEAEPGRGSSPRHPVHDDPDHARRARGPLHQRHPPRTQRDQPRAAGCVPQRRLRAPRRGGGPGGGAAHLQRLGPSSRTPGVLRRPAAVRAHVWHRADAGAAQTDVGELLVHPTHGAARGPEARTGAPGHDTRPRPEAVPS